MQAGLRLAHPEVQQCRRCALLCQGGCAGMGWQAAYQPQPAVKGDDLRAHAAGNISCARLSVGKGRAHVPLCRRATVQHKARTRQALGWRHRRSGTAHGPNACPDNEAARTDDCLCGLISHAALEARVQRC